MTFWLVPLVKQENWEIPETLGVLSFKTSHSPQSNEEIKKCFLYSFPFEINSILYDVKHKSKLN